MFPVGASIQVEDQMEVGGEKMIILIFLFRSSPCSFYSGSKALGEEVLEEAENCFVLRFKIPFNHQPSPKNYLHKLLNYENLLEVENLRFSLRGILPQVYRLLYQGY